MAKNNLRTEYNAAVHRLEALSARREILNKEHVAGVSARRDLLLGDSDDIKILDRANARVVAAESALAGLEDALVVQRAKVAELTAALAAEQDQEQRDAKAGELEACIPRIQGGITDLEPGLKNLAAELTGCGLPEGRAAGLLLDDTWQQVVCETAKITAELAADARHLRNTPTAPKPPEFHSQSPLRPAPHRQGDLAHTQFVDWSAAR